MMECELNGVEFIVCNTDTQALENSRADDKLRLGEKLTNGLGAGADPQIGWKSAMESQADIASAIEGSDMIFVTCGLGGGTGTGAAPVVCQTAKEAGILTVAVVTMPFIFEGARRMKHAEAGLAQLKKHVDTLIVIPNDRLLELGSEDLSMLDAFRCADNILMSAVRGISDIIVTPGLINVDFKDVRAVMMDGGLALMGQGVASGEGRALAAAQIATNSPLLDGVNIEGATGILVNITGGSDLGLREVNTAMTYIQQNAHPDANIIFGSVIDEQSNDEVRITVIATGGCGASQRIADTEQEVVLEAVGQDSRALASQQTSLPTVHNPYELPAAQRRANQTPAPASAPVATQKRPETTALGTNTNLQGSNRTASTATHVAIDPFPGNAESEYDTPAFLRRK
jgi:cell division protein FtsZ